MARPIILGLLGRAGVGKSSVAGMLEETMGFQRISLAKPLKDIVAHAMDFHPDQVFGSGKDVVDERYGFTPRHYLQAFGTAARERMGKDVWIQAMFNQVRNHIASFPQGRNTFVVDDCRYLNEVQAIYNSSDSVRHSRGYVIHLVNPKEKVFPGEHASESESHSIRPCDVNAVVFSEPERGLVKLFDDVRHEVARLEGHPTLRAVQVRDRDGHRQPSTVERCCTHLECPDAWCQA